MQQRIQHSTVRVARTRVHNQITWFVDDQDVVIFIDDIERNILRFKTHVFLDLNIDRDGFAAKNFFFRLVDDVAVYQHALVKDPFFYPRT